ncbi:MAG: very short patch repair endonuclease [Elusimicrobiota bacterium]
MADVFTAAKRSEVMALIRSKNTKPEIVVRHTLHALGLRFRLHVPELPGRPDIVIKKLMLIVHVKGCFWHGHRCLKGRMPVGNRPYWREKLTGNKARDKRNDRRLRAMGWTVKTVWECRVRSSSPEELAIALCTMLLGLPPRARSMAIPSTAARKAGRVR